jgi:hypothetical protein
VGIVTLAVGTSEATRIVTGVLVLTFCGTAITGYILGSIFLARDRPAHDRLEQNGCLLAVGRRKCFEQRGGAHGRLGKSGHTARQLDTVRVRVRPHRLQVARRCGRGKKSPRAVCLPTSEVAGMMMRPSFAQEREMISAFVMVGLMQLAQHRVPPRLTCPKGASQVELPASSGGKVLRCVDDTTGNPNGPEVWLRASGFYWQRGRWENGKRHGTWDRWYATGHHMSRVDYNLGQVVATRCLAEEKRREQKCSDEWLPRDWKPPANGDGAKAADPQSNAGPAIAPMPPLPGEAGETGETD